MRARNPVFEYRSMDWHSVTAHYANPATVDGVTSTKFVLRFNGCFSNILIVVLALGWLWQIFLNRVSSESLPKTASAQPRRTMFLLGSDQRINLLAVVYPEQIWLIVLNSARPAHSGEFNMALVKTSRIAGSEAESQRPTETARSSVIKQPPAHRDRRSRKALGEDKISEWGAATTEELTSRSAQATAAAEELRWSHIPEDITEKILFFLTPGAFALTGQALPVDAGFVFT